MLTDLQIFFYSWKVHGICNKTHVTISGALKMRDWKMRDWNYREQETYGTPRVA